MIFFSDKNIFTKRFIFKCYILHKGVWTYTNKMVLPLQSTILQIFIIERTFNQIHNNNGNIVTEQISPTNYV